MKTLSELQLATLANLNIPVWQLRTGISAVTTPGDDVQQAPAAETPADNKVTAEVETETATLSSPKLEAKIEKVVLPGIAVAFEHHHNGFVLDVLSAWQKHDLPVVNQPSTSSHESYEFHWYQSDEIKLTDDAIYTPSPSHITPQQKRQLWHVLSQC